jgi:DNA-binding MarR family transcriptional regulator
MRLEDEIRQKAFRSEYHKLAINLLYTHGWLAGLHAQAFRPYGLTIAQYNILRILRGSHPDPASVALLRERMLDKMSDASRLIDRLEKKGLVERHVCPDDRRRSDVSITRAGLDLLADLDEVERKLDDAFSIISGEEAKHVNDILDRLRGGAPPGNGSSSG